MKPITTIVIADDHPLFRRGLVDVISETGKYKIIAEAGDGRQAVDEIVSQQPDCAILDIGMPVMDGFEVLIKCRNIIHPPVFIMLTMYDDAVYLHKALEYGVKGYVLKDNSEQEIVSCISQVERGTLYLSPSVSHHLVNPFQSILNKLTSMERKVFMLVSDFKTSGEIADLLSISVRTVENHRAHICKKLDLSGPHALAQYTASFSGKNEA